MKILHGNIILIFYISLIISACVPPAPLPTSTVTVPSTETLTPEPTSSPIPPSDTPTSTPLPPPLKEIFPQVGDGIEFTFPENQPNLIKKQFIETGGCSHSGPFGLQLTYNFTAGGGGWGVHWAVQPLNHFNLAQEGYTALSFWVKGITGGETFQIGLKDTKPYEVKVDSARFVQVSATEWRPVEVSLKLFADNKGQVNTASINNISFTFEQRHGSGSICIDDVAFK